MQQFDPELNELLQSRQQVQVFTNGRDATPRTMKWSDLIEFEHGDGADKVDEFPVRRSNPVEFEVKQEQTDDNPEDIDDMVKTLESQKIDDIANGRQQAIAAAQNVKTKIHNPYDGRKLTHIRLVDSGVIEIFDFPSQIEPPGTAEAEKLQKFNKHYQNLTEGDGKTRPRSTAETQTEIAHRKPKATATEIQSDSKATNVRNFDIFDTFSGVDATSDVSKVVNDVSRLAESRNFFNLVLNVERLLAGNVFRDEMKMYKLDNISPATAAQHASNPFNLRPLWTLNYPADDGNLNVVSMSWSDELVAVAYGDFIASDDHDDLGGLVAVWTYKNPVNPERKYKFSVGVCDVKFSPKNRQILAVSFNDGSVQILDITEFMPIAHLNLPIIARTDEETKLNSVAILTMQWIEAGDVEFLFCAAIDGRVIKYQIGSGGRLAGSEHIAIERVEGRVEGLASVEHTKSIEAVESERNVKILSMAVHPERRSEFSFGTDEGCVYTCSAVFISRILSQLQAQEHGIDSIEFSPFIASLFLTAGIDRKIHVWMENVLEPLMEFGDGFASYHCVKWSKIHPTIVMGCSHDALRVWDLSRKAEKPIHVEKFEFEATIFDFSPSGTSVLVGDMNGNVHVYYIDSSSIDKSLDPVRELKRAVYGALRRREKLNILSQVKNNFK